jgi:hypothetical protein
MFSYVISRTCYIQWNDGDVHFVQDHHASLELYSANSLKQESAVTTIRHIILIPDSLLFVPNDVCLLEKHQMPIL